MSTEGSNRAIVAALLANLGIAATKFLAWLLTRSSSMLAESIHSVADSGNQLLLLIGGKRAVRGPTPQHPFGFGRERYLYAFIVSVVLFSVGGLFALYEGYHKLHETLSGHPNELLESRWWWVPLVVLSVAIVLETYSFRTAIRESNRVRRGASWLRFIRHARAPELPVVLLEDAAALLGLVFALLGVGLSLLTGDGIWDGVFTLAIGALLVLVAVVLAVETKSLLIGESATEADQQAIVAAVADGPEVDRIIHLRTLHLGPEELLVAAKIGVRERESAQELARNIDAVEARIRAAVPIARVVYLEPDIYRASEATGGTTTDGTDGQPDPAVPVGLSDGDSGDPGPADAEPDARG